MPKQYCICRSTEDKSFMIMCDKCEEWFHGTCVNVDPKLSKKIEAYFCDKCIEANPQLSIRYKAKYAVKIEQPKLNLPKIPKQSQSQNAEKQSNSLSSTTDFDKVTLPKPVPPSTKPSQLRQTQEKSLFNEPIRKPNIVRRKPGPKPKSKNHHKKQCLNPDCRHETRPDSNYCSEECGLALNKLRYERFYLPKKHLYDNSIGRSLRINQRNDLMQQFDEVILVINNLRKEKEELERQIKLIKEEANAKYRPKVNNTNKDKNQDNNDSDDQMETEDSEEILSGDATKTYCITCGATISASQALKHWSACHKKNEDIYNFTANEPINITYPDTEDPEPKLRCNNLDKKTKRFCMNVYGACPLHSNWTCGKDEVCGCPLNVMQKLVVDGNYCLELKKDCLLHYHWDKFRLAQINMERLQAFTEYDILHNKISRLGPAADSSGGGVVGVMSHNTIEEHIEVD